jgi:hypothetical protein
MLVPFKQLPDSDTKNWLDPPLLHSDYLVRLGLKRIVLYSRSPSSPSAALIKKVQLRPKSVGHNENISENIPISNLLYEACESLTLVGTCTPMPIAEWTEVEDWVPCSGFLGSGWSSPVHDVVNPLSFKITDELLGGVKAVIAIFLNLEQNLKDKLRIPIQRLNQSRRRQNVADRAIDLGIAFESLYLGDRPYTEHISLTFRLRAAWYLGKDSEDRKRLMEMFNAIYNGRSEAVHTGKLDSEIKIKGKGRVGTHAFLDEADALCSSSIKKIINDGAYPQFDDLILGS